MSSGSDKIWPAISRASAAAKSVADMVKDLYGSGPKGGPDYKAAGEALGRHPSTIRSWNRTGLPRSGSAVDLKDNHSSWSSGPEGRRDSLNSRRESRLRNSGTSLVISGRFRVSDGEDNRGVRTVSVTLSGARMNAIMDALLAGDDARAHRILEEAVGDKGFGATPDIDIAGIRTLR